jgi:hypothetical protein
MAHFLNDKMPPTNKLIGNGTGFAHVANTFVGPKSKKDRDKWLKSFSQDEMQKIDRVLALPFSKNKNLTTNYYLYRLVWTMSLDQTEMQNFDYFKALHTDFLFHKIASDATGRADDTLQATVAIQNIKDISTVKEQIDMVSQASAINEINFKDYKAYILANEKDPVREEINPGGVNRKALMFNHTNLREIGRDWREMIRENDVITSWNPFEKTKKVSLDVKLYKRSVGTKWALAFNGGYVDKSRQILAKAPAFQEAELDPFRQYVTDENGDTHKSDIVQIPIGYLMLPVIERMSGEEVVHATVMKDARLIEDMVEYEEYIEAQENEGTDVQVYPMRVTEYNHGKVFSLKERAYQATVASKSIEYNLKTIQNITNGLDAPMQTVIEEAEEIDAIIEAEGVTDGNVEEILEKMRSMYEAKMDEQGLEEVDNMAKRVKRGDDTGESIAGLGIVKWITDNQAIEGAAALLQAYHEIINMRTVHRRDVEEDSEIFKYVEATPKIWVYQHDLFTWNWSNEQQTSVFHVKLTCYTNGVNLDTGAAWGYPFDGIDMDAPRDAIQALHEKDGDKGNCIVFRTTTNYEFAVVPAFSMMKVWSEKTQSYTLVEMSSGIEIQLQYKYEYEDNWTTWTWDTSNTVLLTNTHEFNQDMRTSIESNEDYNTPAV